MLVLCRSLGGNLKAQATNGCTPFYICMKHKIIYLIAGIVFTSCGGSRLVSTDVAYVSVKTRHMQPSVTSPIPNEAKIAVAYSISPTGDFTAVVYNRTSEIMTIDQTKSFFVGPDGKSLSYYDPTVRTTSTTDMSSVSKGGSLNLGAVAGVLGIGGVIGQLADGINIGGSGTKGTSVTNATYIADMPKVSLAPFSNGAMSKVFNLKEISSKTMSLAKVVKPLISEQESFCKFSFCVSYSLDGGVTYEKLVTNFYADSKIVIPVSLHGQVNDALRQIYKVKPNLWYEPWWLLYFPSNISDVKKHLSQGLLYDYQ